MKLRTACAALCALAVLAFATPAMAGSGLRAYKVKISSAKTMLELKRQGYDITEGHSRRGKRLEIVATKRQIRALRQKGLSAKRISGVARASAAADGGWQVWRPYARSCETLCAGGAGNPTDNIMTQLEKLAAAHPNITQLETIGKTIKGVPIYAMEVTKDADGSDEQHKPAVLYSSLQHAREWLAGETGRRTLRLFLDNYGKSGGAIGTDGQPVAGVSATELTQLVNTRELWFILVANPDGYDYTFTPANRLWRKNLHDNNGDGQITAIDGVDPNRNFPTRWRYDDEGSSSEWGSETYRGAGPGSEPETQAFTSLMDKVDFAFNKNDHTHGRLLLYPFGWQIDTHAADEPIFTALAGDDSQPGIPTFDPDLGAELYTTNGDTNDHMYASEDHTISYTPEGTPAATGSGFVFQDVEKDVQAEFERHVQFALDLARSADDPDNPESHLGRVAADFVVDDFSVSYGDPQTVQVNARRDLGAVTLNYSINDGPVQTKATSEWAGGDTYGDDGDVWYHRMRGEVTGTKPGDRVKVWFTAPSGKKSSTFQYQVRSDSGARVLVLAAEDYSGVSAFPAYPSNDGPFYLSYYTQALEQNGIAYDVYDIDAEKRVAPDPLGVLSHYDAVIWYTGNDNVTRDFNKGGVAGIVAHDTTMAVRDFVNEGKRVALAGVNAGRQYDLVEYAQEGTRATLCDGDLQTTDGGKCNPLSNDFLQYYLGSFIRIEGGGLSAVDPPGVFPVQGTAGGPFDGLGFDLNGADSAGNQEGELAGTKIGTATHIVTSSVLTPADYPQFSSSRQVADWVLGDGKPPLEPHSGTHYLYSQSADQAYKRFRRQVDLSGLSGSDPAELEFWTSFNTELDWDYAFVEVAQLDGSGNPVESSWTTLPDQNGNTSQDTGASCPEGWSDLDTDDLLHEQLAYYQTRQGDADGDPCVPTGKFGGQWNAATGNSAGWKQWKIDLSAYRGKRIELSIVYATDWGTLGVPGVLVDDVSLTLDSNVQTVDFETAGDLGGWDIPGAHEAGPSTNANDWIVSERIPFEDASIVASDDGLLFGFGFEGVNGAGNRATLMQRTVDYLLAD